MFFNQVFGPEDGLVTPPATNYDKKSKQKLKNKQLSPNESQSTQGILKLTLCFRFK